jgi:hypothetical protein
MNDQAELLPGAVLSRWCPNFEIGAARGNTPAGSSESPERQAAGEGRRSGRNWHSHGAKIRVRRLVSCCSFAIPRAYENPAPENKTKPASRAAPNMLKQKQIYN